MTTSQTNTFTPIAFEPPKSYGLSIEVLPISEFKPRLADTVYATQRLLFHMIFMITDGEFVHSVDCVTYRGQAKDCLLVKPNQLQQYSGQMDCEGWVMLISPSFFQTSSLAEDVLFRLPTCFSMNDRLFNIARSHLELMSEDIRLITHREELNQLLRYQLSSLIVRLRLEDELFNPNLKSDDVNAARFKRFRLLLEKHFATQHQASFYAEQLGLSLKTFNRLCLKMVGESAKTQVAERIILEAKRLLVHTNLPIQMIADALAFDDVSNFCKVFKTNTGRTPRQFRILQQQAFH